MDNELYRLASFNSFTHVEGSYGRSILTLARKGFYYDSFTSTIICNRCSGRYSSTNDAFCEHDDVMATTTTNNAEETPTTLPLQSSTNTSSILSTAPNTLKEVFDACERRAHKTRNLSSTENVRSQQHLLTLSLSNEQSRTTDTQISVLHTTENDPISQTTPTPSNLSTSAIIPTDYSTILLHYEQRLRSFVGAPCRTSGPSVEELAWYGWRYDPNDISSDRVTCVYCKGNLRDWTDDDDAEEEHKRWYSHCKFVNIIGSYPFKGVKRRDQIAINRQMNFYDQTTTTPKLSNVHAFEPREIKARMDTTMARTIMNMGYAREIVKTVIQERLQSIGDDFPSVAEFLDAVITKAEQQQEPGPLGASNWTSNLPSTAETELQLLPPVVNMSPPNNDDTVAPAKKESHKKKKRNRKQQNQQALQTLPETLQNLSISNTDNNIETNDENDQEYQSLVVENTKLKDARTCKICMELEVNTVFLPCGHLIACNVCAPKVRNCPLCRTFIRGTVKTFLS